MNLDLKACCRLCLTSERHLRAIGDSIADKINAYLPITLTEDDDDCLPHNICSECCDTLTAFDSLYHVTRESQERALRILEKNRRDDEQEAADLAEALMLSDGDNLRLNFAATQDDGSDKSLSIETDLAKDIDRILAMTQLDDISGAPSQIYSCDFCQPQPPIATQSELNEHLKSAHIDLVFHCETCDNFIDRNSLIEHMMQHLRERMDGGGGGGGQVRVEEPDEPEEEEEENENEENILEKEEENDDEEEEKSNESAFEPKEKRNLLREAAGSNVKFLKKCRYCAKLFSNRSGRLYHQEQVHFNRRRFQCDKCELSFGLKQTLMNHIRNKHSNNVRSFQCDLCSKAYKTKSALHNHKVYHSKEDPKYHCNYCPKKFHFNFLLQQHETIHLGLAKSFDCEVCKKSFNTRNKLTKHRGIHADDKYACTIEGCTFKGNLKRYLIAHTKRMHS